MNVKRYLFFLTALVVIFSAAGLSAQFSSGCIQMLDEIICPPPNGGTGRGMDGVTVCGPGQCAKDSSGTIMCSSLPGGLITMDLNGNALCVGGCIKGEKHFCIKPTR